MDALTRFSQTASLLQDGVSSARATLRAIFATGMFDNSPAGQKEADDHNHGTVLLAMLESYLDAVQGKVDGLDPEGR